jgi:hypothetical protein
VDTLIWGHGACVAIPAQQSTIMLARSLMLRPLVQRASLASRALHSVSGPVSASSSSPSFGIAFDIDGVLIRYGLRAQSVRGAER